MLRNKRGNIFFGVVVALIVWFFGVLFIPFITDDVTSARDLLDCSNNTISDGTKLNCLTVDIVIPYFIWTLMSLAVGFLVGSQT